MEAWDPGHAVSWRFRVVGLLLAVPTFAFAAAANVASGATYVLLLTTADYFWFEIAGQLFSLGVLAFAALREGRGELRKAARDHYDLMAETRSVAMRLWIWAMLPLTVLLRAVQCVMSLVIACVYFLLAGVLPILLSMLVFETSDMTALLVVMWRNIGDGTLLLISPELFPLPDDNDDQHDVNTRAAASSDDSAIEMTTSAEQQKAASGADKGAAGAPSRAAFGFALLLMIVSMALHVYDTYSDVEFCVQMYVLTDYARYGLISTQAGTAAFVLAVISGAVSFVTFIGSLVAAAWMIRRGMLTWTAFVLDFNPLASTPEAAKHDRSRHLSPVKLMRLIGLFFGNMLQFVLVLATTGYFASGDSSEIWLRTTKAAISAASIVLTISSTFSSWAASPDGTYPLARRTILFAAGFVVYGGTLALLVALSALGRLPGSSVCAAGRIVDSVNQLGVLAVPCEPFTGRVLVVGLLNVSTVHIGYKSLNKGAYISFENNPGLVSVAAPELRYSYSRSYDELVSFFNNPLLEEVSMPLLTNGTIVFDANPALRLVNVSSLCGGYGLEVRSTIAGVSAGNAEVLHVVCGCFMDTTASLLGGDQAVVAHLDVLENIGYAYTVNVTGSPTLRTLRLHNNTEQYADLILDANPVLEAVEFAGAEIFVHMMVRDNPLLHTLDVPNVRVQIALAGYIEVYRNPRLVFFSLPMLRSASALYVGGALNFTSLFLPSLKDVSRYFQVDTVDGLTSITAPLLETVGNVRVLENVNLTTLSLPSLSHIYALCILQNNPRLVNVDMANVVSVGVSADDKIFAAAALSLRLSTVTQWPFPNLRHLALSWLTVRLNAALSTIDLSSLERLFFVNPWPVDATANHFISFRQNPALTSVSANVTTQIYGCTVPAGGSDNAAPISEACTLGSWTSLQVFDCIVDPAMLPAWNATVTGPSALFDGSICRTLTASLA